MHRYFDSPPRFQVRHCLRNCVHGGTSLFLDAFATTFALCAEHPAEVVCLVATPVSYINDDTTGNDNHNNHEAQAVQRHSKATIMVATSATTSAAVTQ
jgi:hypothetical protein